MQRPTNAIKFLQNFDSYSEYQSNLQTLIEYVETLEKQKTITIELERNRNDFGIKPKDFWDNVQFFQ